MWKHISTFGMQNDTNYYYLQFEAIHVDKVGIMTTSKVLLQINFNQYCQNAQQCVYMQILKSKEILIFKKNGHGGKFCMKYEKQ